MLHGRVGRRRPFEPGDEERSGGGGREATSPVPGTGRIGLVDQNVEAEGEFGLDVLVGQCPQSVVAIRSIQFAPRTASEETSMPM